jgi:hypothetical protein
MIRISGMEAFPVVGADSRLHNPHSGIFLEILFSHLIIYRSIKENQHPNISEITTENHSLTSIIHFFCFKTEIFLENIWWFQEKALF